MSSLECHYLITHVRNLRNGCNANVSGYKGILNVQVATFEAFDSSIDGHSLIGCVEGLS